MFSLISTAWTLFSFGLHGTLFLCGTFTCFPLLACKTHQGQKTRFSKSVPLVKKVFSQEQNNCLKGGRGGGEGGSFKRGTFETHEGVRSWREEKGRRSGSAGGGGRR